MTTRLPQSALSSGAIFHLVGLAADAAESGDPLEWQVLRYRRIQGVEYTRPSWTWPLQPAAAQLDYLAHTFIEEFFSTCPPAARTLWSRAAGKRTVPEFMNDLATLLRMACREPEATYEEIPLAGWELAVRFPRLLGLETWLDPAFPDEEDPIRAATESEHPYCAEVLPELIAQVTQALALCRDSEAFAAQLRAHCGSAAPEVLAEVADLAYAHMAREHRNGTLVTPPA
ncbi:hypothetical protein [Streptomyces sp. NBC_01445]|uniref:hypothetical protein n=1 Tax=Streptomyces sp. NBC_01445 TaxID=2903869 RepID=UPI002DDA590B|nr:hypothetical protein [Streptomyces sp. NBC_01445]WSE05592.1 hypothetical protein OG574_20830 [Streptomyces sp. NBC_01445]